MKSIRLLTKIFRSTPSNNFFHLFNCCGSDSYNSSIIKHVPVTYSMSLEQARQTIHMIALSLRKSFTSPHDVTCNYNLSKCNYFRSHLLKKLQKMYKSHRYTADKTKTYICNDMQICETITGYIGPDYLFTFSKSVTFLQVTDLE